MKIELVRDMDDTFRPIRKYIITVSEEEISDCFHRPELQENGMKKYELMKLIQELSNLVSYLVIDAPKEET